MSEAMKPGPISEADLCVVMDSVASGSVALSDMRKMARAILVKFEVMPRLPHNDFQRQMPSREWEIDCEMRVLLVLMAQGKMTESDRQQLDDLQRERVRRMIPASLTNGDGDAP